MDARYIFGSHLEPDSKSLLLRLKDARQGASRLPMAGWWKSAMAPSFLPALAACRALLATSLCSSSGVEQARSSGSRLSWNVPRAAPKRAPFSGELAPAAAPPQHLPELPYGHPVLAAIASAASTDGRA